ncbi:glycosyltransferase family 9 protein [Haliovirga abyssi]|uniref:ADP-heptose--LPS heptosyltransferase n=1 Tax=Haliovirga abyssi TaxID=2996794 RepID=A0AAU9D137_9FUSO|nr:glycosyltransferase family 9 protein [Haliovirga abyssi]BDU49684.1 ADP-heptose--LPS heptosyltransferase [Haliovirga abyssi]
MKILVIQLKQIGDVLLSTPVCNSLKKTYSSAQIDYIIYDYTAGVVDNNPSISKIIKITKKERESYIEFLKLLLKIRKEKYDIVLNIQGKLEGTLITLASGAKLKIGFDRKGWEIFHTKIVNESNSKKITGAGNTIDGRLSLLTALDDEVKYDYDLKIYLKDDEVIRIKNKMIKFGINIDRPIISMGITSRRDYRIWPVEYFSKIMDYLIKKYNAQIILFYAPNDKKYNSEKDYCEAAKKLVENNKNVFTNIETENVRELLCLLKNSDIYIGNDNGPRHFAQGVDTPAFCIFSPTANKWDFNPHNNPRFRAIDLQDALGLDNEKYKEYTKNLDRDKNSMEYFKEIKPEFVISEIDKMIKELNLFK